MDADIDGWIIRSGRATGWYGTEDSMGYAKLLRHLFKEMPPRFSNGKGGATDGLQSYNST